MDTNVLVAFILTLVIFIYVEHFLLKRINQRLKKIEVLLLFNKKVG